MKHILFASIILINLASACSLAQSPTLPPLKDNRSIFDNVSIDDAPKAKVDEITKLWPKIFTSQQGLYILSIEPMNGMNSPKTIPMRKLHRWKMHITDPDGKPISRASVLIDGGMPAHAHGLPSVPKVKAVSNNGDYIIDGMKFNMGGEWLLRFAIIHEQKDRAQVMFELAH